MNLKYEIARNNVLLQKNFKPHDDIIEVLQVNARSSFESRIIYKNWIIDDGQWLSNQHIYIIQNLIVKRFGSILNLTGLLYLKNNPLIYLFSNSLDLTLILILNSSIQNPLYK